MLAVTDFGPIWSCAACCANWWLYLCVYQIWVLLFSSQGDILFLMTKCRTGYSNWEMCDLIFGGHLLRWSFKNLWILKYFNTSYARTILHKKLLDYADDFPSFYDAINISSRSLWSTILWMNKQRSKMVWTFFRFLFLASSTAWSTVWVDPFQGLMEIMSVLCKRLSMTLCRGWFIRATKNVMALKLRQLCCPKASVLFLVQHLLGNMIVVVSCRWVVLIIFWYRFSRVSCMCIVDLATWLTMCNICNASNRITFLVFPGWTSPLIKKYATTESSLSVSSQAIECSYGDVKNIFQICSHPQNYKLGTRMPSVMAQLCICKLLSNIYTCLNGNKASSYMKFNVMLPTLEDYMESW